MKYGFLTAMLLFSTSAFASDPVLPSSETVVRVGNWSGFYVGINGGWGQSHDNRGIDGLGSLSSYDASGGSAGGQIGYRWQTSGWVFGLEAQGNWADISGSNANLVVPGGVVRSKMDAFGLLTGQVGYVWSDVLLYAKGGLAVTNRNYQFLAPGGAFASETGFDTRISGTAGAGLELGLAENWSLGIEYNHIFDDHHSVTFTTPNDLSVGGFSSGGGTNLVLGRLNYKFGGSTSAKY
ncbi:outer membrane protein [Phyllobacterium sp. TAF24]|uniref:outer membrane protein n=1 Tax=Phyllobacterium sp. TAF24 TaxID=3233068 RepID=UPI003F982426